LKNLDTGIQVKEKLFGTEMDFQKRAARISRLLKVKIKSSEKKWG
jgi:hypothetical protein